MQLFRRDGFNRYLGGGSDTLTKKNKEGVDQGVSYEQVLICHPSEDAQEGGRAVYLRLQKRVMSEAWIQESMGIQWHLKSRE